MYTCTRTHSHSLQLVFLSFFFTRGFLPGAGPLLYMDPPATSEHVRVDTGVQQGKPHTHIVQPWNPYTLRLIFEMCFSHTSNTWLFSFIFFRGYE